MWPDLFVYKWFVLSVWSLYLAGGVITGSFILWRKFRLDMSDEEIFGQTIFLFLATGSGCIAGSLLDTGNWLGVSGWGILIGGWWGLKRWSNAIKLDPWEMFDWAAIAAMWFWFVGSLAWGPKAMYGAAAAFVGIILTAVVKANYRKFPWYASGRVGIVGISGLLVYSIYEIVSALFQQTRVYWWGLSLGQTLAAWVIAFCLVTVYLRGGYKFKF